MRGYSGNECAASKLRERMAPSIGKNYIVASLASAVVAHNQFGVIATSQEVYGRSLALVAIGQASHNVGSFHQRVASAVTTESASCLLTPAVTRSWTICLGASFFSFIPTKEPMSSQMRFGCCRVTTHLSPNRATYCALA